MNEDPEEPVNVPITGELDLHTFRPKEVRELIPDYIDECLKLGIHALRIVHGKGTGTMRELVHKKLRQNPAVASFRLGDEQTGSWGATLVQLKKEADA
ncbi:MAG: DNA-nicking Smr family endonuclease [Verrucomicrobiales bacterium]|jgi:DNA-nicking Smr family endonuclease